jgi:hypothetical protein
MGTNVIHEICWTEKTFINILLKIIEFWKSKTKEKGILTSKEHQTIFYDHEVIYSAQNMLYMSMI